MLPEIEKERKTERKHEHVAKRARLLVSQSLRQVRFFLSVSLSPRDGRAPTALQRGEGGLVLVWFRSAPRDSRTGWAAGRLACARHASR